MALVIEPVPAIVTHSSTPGIATHCLPAAL